MNRPYCSEKQQGYTLVELLAVLVVAFSLVGIHLRGPPPDPFARVREAAYEVEASIRAARAEASSIEGSFTVLVDPLVSGDVRGRLLAAAAPMGTESIDTTREWVTLRRGVQWGRGAAEYGLLNEPIEAVAVPAVVRCTPGSCAMGDLERAIYYITHARTPSAVSAVVITADGDLMRYNYIPDRKIWEPGT